MDSISQTRATLRFGTYEVDLPGRVLRRGGIRVRLQEKPFRLLALLLARPGTVVTREEAQRELWPQARYGELELGLNTAVKKLRQALGDSAEDPRWIETVPKVGYRFLGPVTRGEPAAPVPADKRRSATDSARRRVERLALALVAVAAVVFSSLWIGERMRPQEARPVQRFSFIGEGRTALPTVSPNGRHIAYLNVADARAIWVRDLDSETPRRLDGTEGAAAGPTYAPIWSPDSRFIAFVAGGELRKISIDGGPAIVLCALPGLSFGGGSWQPDGERIVFSATSGSPGSTRLYAVSAQGGSATLLLEPDASLEDAGFGWPHFVNYAQDGDSDRLLLYGSIRGRVEEASIHVRNLKTGDDRELLQGMFPVFSPTGHILYLRREGLDVAGADLWAVPFSVKTLEATGEPFALFGDVFVPTVSADGTLVYYEGARPSERLTWRDRQGNVVGRLGEESARMRQPRISPDGRRVALQIWADSNFDVWVQETTRPARIRLTIDPSRDNVPVWAPSGESVTFRSRRTGGGDVYQMTLSGGKPTALIASDAFESPTDWSADERTLLFDREGDGTGLDVWYASRLDDGSLAEPVAFLATPFEESAARIAPDGRHVAYVSDESGRPEVYIQRFPEGGEKQRVSRRGGAQPVWRPDGRELYYVEGSTLMAVEVTASPELSIGSAEPLFTATALRGSSSTQYDVASDGARFLLVEPVEGELPPTIRVVVNWYEAFRDRESPRQ